MKSSKAPVVLALVLAVIAAPLAAETAQAGRVPRIGFLANDRSPGTEAFEKGLRDLRYVEGQTIIVEWRFAEGRLERLPVLAAELVRLNVDVIVAPAPPYVEAARKAGANMPIVFAVVPDPVQSGFVASLARPGGNITGLASRTSDLASKRLELLKEALPRLAHVALLVNPPIIDARLREVQRAVAVLGLQGDVVSVARPEAIDEAFASLTNTRVDAVLEVQSSPMLYAHRQRIADAALRSRLPMSCYAREYVEAGCLLSYGASVPDLMRRAAQYVDRILRGAKPADLPVEQPTKFDLVVNLRTARALGLAIPPSLLLRADQTIE